MQSVPTWAQPASREPNDHDLLEYVLDRRPSIMDKVEVRDDGGCWEWLGAKTRNGYGQINGPKRWLDDGPFGARRQSRTLRAHRAVFMIHHGRPIELGMTLHHVCENPGCVSPEHLTELPLGENIRATAKPFGGASIRVRHTKAGVPRYAVLFNEDGRQRSKTFSAREAAEEYVEYRRSLREAG